MTDPHGWWGYRPGIVTVGAVKPGHAPDGETRKRYTAAAKQYARCEKCPWPDGCHYPRCAGPKERKPRGRSMDASLAADLWEKGKSYEEIAFACGVSVSTVTRWAHNTRHYRNAKKDPCPGCYAERLCRAKGISCQSRRDYERWKFQND